MRTMTVDPTVHRGELEPQVQADQAEAIALLEDCAVPEYPCKRRTIVRAVAQGGLTWAEADEAYADAVGG